MKTVPFTTGELRAALQRVVFVRLTKDLSEDFRAGDVVAAQYWGQGKVVVTRPDGKTFVPVAHMIEGQFIVDFTDDRVIEFHLSSPTQIPTVDPANVSHHEPYASDRRPGVSEVVPPMPPQYRPDWTAIEADAENGKGQ